MDQLADDAAGSVHGDNEMVWRTESHDWAATALGPRAAWPAQLKAVVAMALTNGFPMAVLWGPQRAQIYNDGFRDMLGERHPAALGQSIDECFPESRAYHESVFPRVQAGETVHIEDKKFQLVRHGAAVEGWFTASYSPLRDDHGRVAGVLITALDTSARVLAEAALRESQARQAFLLALEDEMRPLTDALEIQEVAARLLAVHLGVSRVMFIDVEGEVGAARGWVRSQHVARGAPLPARVHLADFGEAAIVAPLRRGEAVVVNDVATEPRLRDANLVAYRAIQVAAFMGVPLVKNGRWVLVLAAHSDVPRSWSPAEVALLTETAQRTWAAAERSAAERARQETEARFRTLADTAPALIWHTDAEGRNLFANRHFVEFSGSSAEELRGTGWYHLIEPAQLAGFIQEYGTAVLARQGWSRRIRLRRRDGAWRWLDHSAQPLLGEDGAYLGHVGVSVDTTDIVEAEAALRELLLEATEARHQAELANAAKDEFLAVLGHELRTPLAAITLWTGVLDASALSAEDRRRAVLAIAESAHSQSRLVDDLIDLSRLTLGRLELHPEPTDVARLVRGSVEAVSSSAEAKKLTLRAELEPELGSAELDGARLKQIVEQLLNNAIKFTPPGGSITITARRLNEDLELEVRDTGAGISREFLPRAIERFSQQGTGIARPYDGLGIGLALATELTVLQGGTIQVDSPGVGQGTVICVRLPWLDAETAGRSHHSDISELRPLGGAPEPLSGLRLLLVQDEPNTLQAMQWVLERAGATVTPVSTVAKAIASLAAAPLPDVVISDLALPDQADRSLLQHLDASAANARRPRPPCCAVSAHARDRDRNAALQAGFDTFLKKPVAPARLIEAIAELHERFEAGCPQPGNAAPLALAET
jgi:PAS domain S-box-containing protein